MMGASYSEFIEENLSVPHSPMSKYRKISDRQISISLIEMLLGKMKLKIFPEGVSDEEFKKYLFAVAHVGRYKAKDVSSGRPSKYDRETLNTQAALLGELLDNETGGWIKLPFFITNCLPALSFPIDIKHALDAGKINLDEARVLSLINRKNLGKKTKREPYHIRRDLLESHLRRKGTQKELRGRVNAALGRTSKADAESVTRVIASLDVEVNKLIELDERDTDHLLWEEMKNLVFLARDVDVTLIGEDALLELLEDIGKIQFKLMKYKPRIKDLLERN